MSQSAVLKGVGPLHPEGRCVLGKPSLYGRGARLRQTSVDIDLDHGSQQLSRRPEQSSVDASVDRKRTEAPSAPRPPRHCRRPFPHAGQSFLDQLALQRSPMTRLEPLWPLLRSLLSSPARLRLRVWLVPLLPWAVRLALACRGRTIRRWSRSAACLCSLPREYLVPGPFDRIDRLSGRGIPGRLFGWSPGRAPRTPLRRREDRVETALSRSRARPPARVAATRLAPRRGWQVA